MAGLGVVMGYLAWALVVALGLGALLAVSTVAYTILRWIGAAYLLWGGYNMLRHPRQRLFLSTDDFTHDYDAFTAAGVVWVRAPAQYDYCTVAVFSDLYGNLWDLVQFT